MIKRLLSGLFWSLGIAAFSLLQAQDMVTVNPSEYSGALKNPFKGFRPGFTSNSTPSNWNEDEYPTLYRHYIPWNVIEDDESDTIDKIRDFCNTSWAGCEAANIKIVPRVYLMYGDGQFYFPSDLPNNVWDSEELKARVLRMIDRLGQLWDDDPRVAWVQTGIIGKWGEQESPVGVDDPVVDPDNSTWVSIMGQAFEAAFPNKMLVVRNQIVWHENNPPYDWGVYWDSFAHQGQYSGSWTWIKQANARGQYLTHPVEGEIAYNWGSGPDDYGSTPTETVSTPSYYNFVINTIKQLHCAGLGWVSSYTQGPSTEVGARLMQKAFGYRFVMNEFSCSARTEPGGTLDIRFNVKNEGSAPMYENWPLAFVLIDTLTRQIAWRETLPDIDITTWQPGDNFDWDPQTNPNGSKIYLAPAQEHVINVSVTVPANLDTGEYLAGVTILEPYSQTPGVFFAIDNFLAESQTQPLCKIGIGVDVVGGHEIDSTIFDDPLLDDNRYYTLEWNGATYTLTTSATTGGTVSPAYGEYPENRKVRLEAIGSLGYVFSEWSGDLSGSENPVVITMDANKNITANFVEVDTFTLTITAANGSIELDPAGGVYNEGTVVTITVNPDLGYKFTEWSGDLSGSENPVTITMDANKSVTANFTSAPIYTLTTSAEGGSILLEPAGPQYTDGTVVRVTAIADVDYTFIGWSGDTLDGEVWENPNYITMDENKSITANFIGPPDETGLWVETFNLPGGTTADSGATAWTATRSSGVFEVISNRLAINDAGPQGVFITEKIDISGGSVDVSVEVEGAGGLDPQNSANEDYFGIFKKVDEGAEELIYENYGTQSAVTVSDSRITGSLLEIVIKGYTTAGDEFYYFNNLKVDYSDPASIEETDRGLPLSTQLIQNYPNPFNPETTIPYQLSRSSQVKLEIYNLLGQPVATLVNEQQPAGFYSVKWSATDNNGRQMASGIYLYRLETNDSVEIKKFILLR